MKKIHLTLVALLLSFCSFALTPITGTTTICRDDTALLSNATPGGTWSSGDPSVVTVDAAGVITGVVNGVADITYTLGASYVTAAVTVNFIPTIIAGINDMCSGLSTTWVDMLPGGVWTSTNNAVATIDPSTGVIVGVAGGVDTIWYVTSPGCYRYQFMNIRQTPTIATPPVITVGGTRTLVGTPSGGTWQNSSTNITLGTSTGIVTGVALGTAAVTYFSSACPANATVIVATTTGTDPLVNRNPGIVSVYPNPATSHVEIMWQDVAACTANIRLIDMTGRVVYQQHININPVSGKSNVALSEISNGMYMITISSPQLNYSSKLQVLK